MNILITGVAGLVGSKLADWIITNKPEYTVIGIDDLSGGYIENVNSKVQFHKVSILDDQIEAIFEQAKPTYVFHFAAYAAECLSPFIRRYNYSTNLVGTASIVNQCIKHNVKRLIFTSSLAVYGEGNGNVLSENLQPSPIDPYGVSKFASELDIKIAGIQHNLDWCILRPHNIYGTKQNIWDKYRNVIGIWMYQALNNQPMTIFGDGSQTRAFSYIDDILEPIFNAAVLEAASREIINLGGIKEYTLNECNSTLCNVIGYSNKQYLEGRHEVKSPIPSWEKSKNILKYYHKTELEDGISNMWNWAKVQPTRKQQIWETYELDKGIYSYWKNND